MKLIKREPWKFLDDYRNKCIAGEWPTFPEILKIQTERFGDRPYLTEFTDDGKKVTFTYSEAYQKIKTLADWLLEKGIKKGDKIAVSGKNSPQWALAYLSTFLASATVVPIDNGLHEPEVINLLNTAKPKIIFADDEKCEYLNKANIEDLEIFSLNATNPEKYIYNLKASAPQTPNEPVTENDIAAILFTSGTTGTPKGVMLSHKNLICDGFIAQTNLTLYPTDVFYALLPIHHAYTMQAAFIVPLICGCEIVFGKSMAVTKLMKELREGKITIMLGVPLLYNKLLAGINKGIKAKGAAVSGIMNFLRTVSFLIKNITGKNLGKIFFKPVLQQANIYTLRVAICGGGPLAKSVFKQYQAMGIDFIQGYGLTETSPIIALNPIEHFKIHSVGRDFSPFEEIKIVDPDTEAPVSKPGDIGEIVIKGPMVMQGYYNMPEETAKMFTKDGFLKTGDLGFMDKEHYVMLCGRAKNLIVTSGGKNVYPEEIEDAFQLYDAVQQITVQGYYKPGDETSEEIEALIYPSDDVYKQLNLNREATAADDKAVLAEIQKIISKVNKTLQPYEQITKVTILKEPMATTTTMKVKRNYKH